MDYTSQGKSLHTLVARVDYMGTLYHRLSAHHCIFAYSHCHMFVHWHHKPEPMPLGSCRRVVLLWAWVGLELVWVVVDWLFEQVDRLLVAGLEQVLRMGIAHRKISLHQPKGSIQTYMCNRQIHKLGQ